MKPVLLENLLSPLQPWLQSPSVSEISINQPGEIWIENSAGISRELVPALNFQHLKNLAKLIATFSEQQISGEQPLLAATLPQGQRIQIVFPPAVSEGTVGISIRKSSFSGINLENYQQAAVPLGQEVLKKEGKKIWRSLSAQENYNEFLKKTILQKRNILISGGTSTGKTTFLNALIKEIPLSERIITIEDVPEIQLIQPNRLSLFASRNRQGLAKIDMQDLVEASLRLRPDRIIIGELRGIEAFSFMRAVNTGHPGSMATLHADTPTLAIEQLILMVMQKNLGLSREQIENYIHMVIDVIVQLKKNEHGIRFISEIIS